MDGSTERMHHDITKIESSLTDISVILDIHQQSSQDLFGSIKKVCNDYFWRGGFFVFITENNHRIKINKKDIQLIREVYDKSAMFDINNTANQMPERIIIFFSNASEPMEFSTSIGHENQIRFDTMQELMERLTAENEAY
jgi:hypothetical protein